jgi:hypothetical protein
MRNLIILFLLSCFSTIAIAQRPIQSERPEVPVKKDSLQRPLITAYKIISISGDTTYVDTSLTIEKYYRFNYLRKDNFELVPFSNVGSPYNRLAHFFNEDNLIPEFGARARHFNFMEVEDIRYYEVPTPLTELYFKTVPEQGQTLDAFFTVNTSPRLNFSAAYKGLRSLGKYQNSLTSTGNFRTTLNYATLNNRYQIKTHFVSQDLLNSENGGLDELAVQQYLDKEEEFEDRSLLEVKFENAENVLFGKRFYLNHEYIVVPGEQSKITLHHVLDFSDKKYIYRQTTPFPGFGVSLRNENLTDEVKLSHINNQVALSLENSVLGRVAVKGSTSYYNYGYNSVIVLEDFVIPNRLVGQNYAAGAEYSNQFGPLAVYGDAMVNLSGEFSGHQFTGGVNFRINPLNYMNIEVSSNERAPNFNYLLYQSNYLNYNWRNNFENESSRVVSARLVSPKIVNVEAALNQVDNYTFFANLEDVGVKPLQYDGTLNYLRIKAQREFHWGKFSLDNTVMYQQVTEGEAVFNVPEFVSRTTLYYGDHWFRRALFVQTGFSMKYFTPYEMNGYDPVLAEFFVQNEAEFGGYPVVDFFFNGRIKQTRIFFQLEHVNSLISGNNNFSAPGYPYRDFLVRFGLVWNFFL